MGKKEEKKGDIMLCEDNGVRSGGYKLEVMEKGGLYWMIGNIGGKYMEEEEGERSLFENVIMRMKEEEVEKCGDNSKMKNMYDGVKGVRNGDIEINKEKMWVSMGFVNQVKDMKNK